jgi:hypothetical protein
MLVTEIRVCMRFQSHGKFDKGISCLFVSYAADMLAATSVLQQQATEIRTQRVNWQSYHQ